MLARRSDREPTLPDVVDVLVHPPAEMAEALAMDVVEIANAVRPMAFALDQLCTGNLRGMFDGPTTPGLDLDAPLVVLNLRAVLNTHTAALGILMTCATAWLQAMIEAETDERSAKRIVVVDEGWRILSSLGIGEWLQQSFKLSRALGTQNIVVLHRLSDLRAAGAEGSRELRLAEGLLADAETKVVYAQPPRPAPAGARAAWSHRHRGRAASRTCAAGGRSGRSAQRSFLVEHRLSTLERELVDTDARMTTPAGGVTSERRPPRFPVSGEGRMHPLESARPVGCSLAVLVVGGCCGLTGEISGRLFGGVWPNTRFAEMGRGTSLASVPTSAIRRSRGPRRERALIPGPIAFYATFAVLLVPICSRRRFCYIRRRARAARSRGAGARWAQHARPPNASRPRVAAPTAHARPHRRPPVAAEPRAVGDRDRADADRQDDRLRDPRDPRVARAGASRRRSRPTSCATRYAARQHDPGRGRPESTTRRTAPAYATAGWTPLAGVRDLAGRPARRRPGSSMPPAPRAPGSRTPRFWYGAAEKLLAPHPARRRCSGGSRWRRSSVGGHPRRRARSSSRLELANEEAATDAFEAILDVRRADPLATSTRPRRRCSWPTPTPAFLPLRRRPTSAPSASSTAAATRPTSARRRTSSAASNRSSRPSSRRSSPTPTSARPETGKPLDPPLLLVLDECANIAPLRDLADARVDGRGPGNPARLGLPGHGPDQRRLRPRPRADDRLQPPRQGDPLRHRRPAHARLRRRAARRRGGAPGCRRPEAPKGDAPPPSPSPTGRSRPRTSCVR